MPALSGVILSGGQSRRMGRDKALLEVGGQRLIDRVVERLREVTDDIIVVANEPERYIGPHRRVIPDAFPNSGSLGGLYSGLVAARHAYVVAVACDMPFLNPALLRFLARAARGWDAALPQVSEGRLTDGGNHAIADRKVTAKNVDLQPLHAVYHRRVGRAILDRLQAGDMRMIGFLPHLRVRYVTAEEIARYDPLHLSFFNANTPEEWAAALERLDG